MQKVKNFNSTFWAGGAREFHAPGKNNKNRKGFITFLNRLFPFYKTNEIDQRLFLKQKKRTNG